MPLVRKPGTGSPGVAVDVATTTAMLASASSDERWSAARSVASQPGGAAMLAAALVREDDRRVQEAMFTGLATIASPESIEALLSFMRSDNARLRTGALDALRVLGPAIAGYMPRLLRDADTDVRLLACELVRNLPEETATQLLCVVLDEDDEPNVCASALEVLAEVGSATALPAIARCAQRFHGSPFLDFSIRHTQERIRAQTDRTS